MSEKPNREKAKVALAVNQTDDAIEALDATPNDDLRELIEEWKNATRDSKRADRYNVDEINGLAKAAIELEELVDTEDNNE